MKRQESDLDRLLRSAASVPERTETEPPFGFETRVIASWRTGFERTDVADLMPLLRRIGAVALVVVLVAGGGVYRLLNDAEAQVTPQTNEYAIADSAIQTEFSQ